MRRMMAIIAIFGLTTAVVTSQGVANLPKISMWNRGVFNLFESGGRPASVQAGWEI